MNLTRLIYTSTAAVGIGAAGLFGLGIGTASADPGQCGGPGQQNCQGPNNGWNNGPDNNGWNNGHDNNGHDNNGHDNNWNNGPGDQNNGPGDWQHRNVDQARQDHQPFNWNGQWVQPMPAGNGAGWGFWFLGQWIPL
ncbi:hypothetical protein Y900_012090 [Mycolicibacterium aromaticivorans JS19b1 = JCM 16368]|uniref:Uncharacterized protein n=1 Tax=Mycolicibacterium aromaticivorans JS19b1 = JCM 16368 TaxID=1440774 RepID=A0A064CLH7_9MYCO|nr:hypothetical protein [Mycolicibacterium aromaticivorans]KDE99657.1 hypothetical protein Y900_012090 [Mycolicibacterium aromaticivorans JS19b1 = JCM 16368]